MRLTVERRGGGLDRDEKSGEHDREDGFLT